MQVEVRKGVAYVDKTRIGVLEKKIWQMSLKQAEWGVGIWLMSLHQLILCRRVIQVRKIFN